MAMALANRLVTNGPDAASSTGWSASSPIPYRYFQLTNLRLLRHFADQVDFFFQPVRNPGSPRRI
jgi:hypothetical protein